MSAPVYPPQTPESLPISASLGRQGDEWYFKLLGRNGSVPPLILSQQKLLERGTQAVLVRFRVRSSLNYPSGASNQGVGVRLRTLTRGGDGRSQTPRIMYDSNPEGTTSDEVWYRDRHSDIREVTFILQMPEEVIGGTHIDIGIYARGSNGSADIFGPVEIRNYYSRTFKERFGKSVLQSDENDPQFFRTLARGIFAGRDAYIDVRSFPKRKATIPKGRAITVSGQTFVNEATIRNLGGAKNKFQFGLGCEFYQRNGQRFWVGHTYAGTLDNNLELRDRDIQMSQPAIAPEDITDLKMHFFFYRYTTGTVIHTLDTEGIDMRAQIDDSVESTQAP